jgi:hypothetical protein
MEHTNGWEESETTSLYLLRFAAMTLRLKDRMESKTGSDNNWKRLVLFSMLGAGVAERDGSGDVEVLSCTTLSRRCRCSGYSG